jgi:hypothetical protein
LIALRICYNREHEFRRAAGGTGDTMTQTVGAISRMAMTALALVMLFAGMAQAQPRGCFGTVRVAKGVVEFMAREGGEWQPAPAHTCLFEGAGLRTGQESGAMILLDDGSEIRLNQDSETWFTHVPERFLLSRLAGMSLLYGEAAFDMTAGYDDIFVETMAGAAIVQGASATVLIHPSGANSPERSREMSVFVLNGAVHVLDVYLNHRITVGPGQQTNVLRGMKPQSAIFIDEKKIAEYVKLWTRPLSEPPDAGGVPGREALGEARRRLLACPPGYYSASLWCCPESCRQGPSSLPADIVCQAGTYYIGNRMCCDDVCRVSK